MANKTHVIVSENSPSEAPPSAGAHYICWGTIYMAAGTESVDDWVVISGNPDYWSGWAQGVEDPLTREVARMERGLTLSKNEGTVGLTTFVFPGYQNEPRGLKLSFYGGTEAGPLPVTLDFSAGGTQTSFGVMQIEGLTAEGGDNGVLQLTFTKDMELSLSWFDFNWDGDTKVGYAMGLDARLLPQYTDLPAA